jgi:alkylation response protein AidB-like acyl-CoA dehydrogenase
MDYFLNDSQKEIQQLARKISETEIRPVAANYDRTGDFPWPLIRTIASNDLFRTFIHETYGGMAGGTPVLNTVLVMEELSRACAGTALIFGGTVLGSLPLILSGTGTQRHRFLSEIAAGNKLASFALSEEQAGSDASAIACTARRDGDFYILNGTKKWITNGGEADIYSVFCLTAPPKGARGISCLIVERGTPGLGYGKVEDKLGMRASATRELVFQDCRVPAENIVGPEGTGLAIAIKSLAISRTGIAAQAIGIAQGAADLAVEYARMRRQFGVPIGSFQGLRFILADMAVQLEAARSLTYSAARNLDAFPEKHLSHGSAMAKCFASDAAMKITINALQVFGAYGYVRDCPIERYMRDAKITQIYEGSNQILLDEIAKVFMRRSVWKSD